MSLKQILETKGMDVVTVTPDTSVLEAVGIMTARNFGLLVVCGGDKRVAGVFSERDLARAVAVHEAAALEMAVGDIMTRDVSVCRVTDSLEHVMEMMSAGRFRHLPVIADGKLAGIISSTDVMRYLGENGTSEERVMFFSKIAWA